MHDTTRPAAPAHPSGMLKRIGIVVAIVAILAVVWGIWSRHRADRQLATWTQDQSIPSVTVVRPKVTGASGALVLPGTVQALNSAPIYARTNGYVSKWFVDIGAPVRAGQLLATIEAPEVEQQLVAAQADLQTARANENLSSTTATRWTALLKQDAVSAQESDEKTGDLAAKKALTNAAAANVGRLRALIGFTRITAPFAGVITSRSTQIGQLVTAGSAAAQPLFTVSDISRVRIYVSVPQAYSAEVHPGLHVALTLPEYPTRKFDAVLVSTANAVDQQSGTELVELQAANPDGALKPGAYAQASFPLAAVSHSVQVPASAVLYRSDGTRVAVVDGTRHVVLHSIKIGRDLGDTLEISAGLAATDLLIDSPPDSIANGDPVRLSPAPPQAAAQQQGDQQRGHGGAQADAAH